MSTKVRTYNPNTKPAKKNGYRLKADEPMTAERFYYDNGSNHPSFGFISDSQVMLVKKLLKQRVHVAPGSKKEYPESAGDQLRSMPEFDIEIGEFMRRLEAYLGLKGIMVYLGGCRVVGSAAQKVLKGDNCDFETMNDLDLTYYLSGDHTERFPDICRAMQELVAGFIADNRAYVSYEDVTKYYLKDLNWIENEADTWCLCSLGTEKFSVDIKFVWTLRRKYAFSLNSFEVIVDDLLHEHNIQKIPVECTFGNYELAMDHLKTGTIFTQNPMSIFRGCLRYCLQLAKGNTVAPENKNYFNYAFAENFRSSFAWGSASYFKKIISRFLNHHPNEVNEFLEQFENLITSTEFPSKEAFLSVLEELKL